MYATDPFHPPSASEWAFVYSAVSAPTAADVAQQVDQQLVPLSATFYRDLLAMPGAAGLISVDALQNRLLPSIQRWLQFLFDPVNATSASPTIALQRHVGEMHARAQVPMHLVSQGFRALKRHLTAVLSTSTVTPHLSLEAFVYASELIDLAHAEMLAAQSRCWYDHTRVDVAVRALTAEAAPSPLEVERHQQLVALSEEETRFLRSVLNTATVDDVNTVGESPFGLWLHHKAPLLFEEAAEAGALKRISQMVAHLDSVVVPSLQMELSTASDVPDRLQPLLREVLAGLGDIRAAVNGLFDRLLSADGYRDSLTQLFNRSLLARILQREMELARRKRSTFSVLLVDIDRFTEHVGTHGQEAGDKLLQQVAALLTTLVRSSDFVFRYGENAFLIVLVELDAAQSLAVAEKIRRTVENADLRLSDGRSVQVTLSLGVALYDGQPDAHSLTVQADLALGRAREKGRNCVEMAHA